MQSVEAIRSEKRNRGYILDYIVINDGSLDNTEEICRDNNIKCINLFQNLGIGGAVQTGYIYACIAHYDIAIQFDGDGQHDINSVDALIKPITEDDADMVVGSRYIDDTSSFKSTFSRRVGIKVISSLIYLLSKKRIKDVTSGYRAVNKDVIKVFAMNYPYDFPEPITNYALLKMNYKVKEIGVNMFERVGGVSSIRALKSIYYMFNVCLSILLFNSKKLNGGVK